MAFSEGGNDWEKYIPITAQATQVDSNESNFPYYYDLSLADATFWSNVQSDGGDLRVTSDEEGTTQVPLEVVAIDTTAETGEIHFKDSTDSSSDKTYYLWYRDSGSSESQPAATDTYGRNAVWSAYEAVYHLQESSGVVIDSTGNGNDGTNNGATTGVSGQIGNGYDVGLSDSISFYTTSASSLYITQWIKTAIGSSSQGSLLNNYGGTGSAQHFLLYFPGNADGKVNLFIDDGASAASIQTTSALNTNTLRKVSASYNAANKYYNVFVDGVEEDSRTHAGNNPNFGQRSFSFGAGHSNLASLADEIRIATQVFSTSWESTEYNMQSSPSTFWSTGTTVEEDTTPLLGGVKTARVSTISYGGA